MLATGIGWRHVLGPILRNQHGPCRTASKHAPVCCPYCDRIATVLMKKHNMSSFFEDFRQKFSGTRFPVHTAVWRPYNLAVLPGRAQRPSHGSIKSPILHPCYTAVQQRPCNTACVIRLCVSALMCGRHGKCPSWIEVKLVQRMNQREIMRATAADNILCVFLLFLSFYSLYQAIQLSSHKSR